VLGRQAIHAQFLWEIPLENEDEEINLLITLRWKEDRTLNNNHCENLKSKSIKMDLQKIYYDDGM
jgi:hypothetical protein